MEEKDKALESAMMQVTRTYGKGSIMKMGDSVTRMSEDVVSTGIFSLDVALGDRKSVV